MLPLASTRAKLTFIFQGPTLEFAVSLRGHSEDEGPGKQAVRKHFATRPSRNESSKVLELSQNWTSRTLKIPLDRYQPKEGDRQYYIWFDNGLEKHYHTPPYGIANLHMARSSIEKFADANSAEYIEAYMRNANQITRKTFQMAQDQKVGLFSITTYIDEVHERTS